MIPILNAKSRLDKLQKQCNLTREDHDKLAKHFTKINTGLDFIDSDML